MPSIPSSGFQKRVGFGLEAHTAPGTKVAPTDAIRSESFSVAPIFSRESVPGIHSSPVMGYYGTAAAGEPRTVDQLRKVEGQWVFPFDFVTWMKVAYLALCKDDGAGAAVGYTFAGNIGPDGAQTGINQHIFKMQSHDQDTARPFSMTSFGGQRQDTFLAMFLKALDIQMNGEGPFMVNCDLLGQDVSKGTAESEPSYGSSPFGRIHEMRLDYHATVGTARASLTTYGNIQQANLRVGHTLREKTSTGTGGPQIRVPIPDDWSEVGGGFTTDFEDTTWQDIWDAATPAGSYCCLEIRITSDNNAGATGFPYAFIARMPACLIKGKYPAWGGGPAAIPEEIEFEAHAFDNSGTIEVVQFEFYNEESTLVGSI